MIRSWVRSGGLTNAKLSDIGQDGHVVRLLAELTLDNDVTAIGVRPRTLPIVEAIEIWEGKRLVDSVRLSPSPPNVAA